LAFATLQQLGPWLSLLRGLQGLAFACWFVNSSTLAVDVVDPARRGSALGLFGVSTLITYGLAPALAEWIAHSWGFAPVFLLALGWSALALLLSLALSTPAPHPNRSKNPGSRSWRQLALEPVIGAICMSALLMGLAFGTVLVFSQAQALARGIAPVSTLTLAFALTSIVMRLGFSRLADGGGKRTILIPSLLAMAAGTGLLAAVDGIGLYALCGVLVGVGHSLAYPTLNVMLINHLPSHEHGRGMSLFIATFNIGTILAQIGLGLLISVVGLHGIFLVAAILTITAITPILRATATPQ
jgi:MFS family permease